MNSKSKDSDITYKSPSICMTASQDPLLNLKSPAANPPEPERL